MADRQAAPDRARKKRISEIRQLALAEVHLRGTGIDAKEYRKELETLIRRPLSIEWLEAQILMSAIAQIRPARTLGHLGKLRDRRQAQGQLDAFNAFEDLLRDYLHPLQLTNHSYQKPTFANLDHAPVWQAVKDHCAALRELGYEAFLNSGTLLGIVRDGALIAHDDDVDLAVILKATNAKDAAQEWQDLITTLNARDLVQPDGKTDPGICKLRAAGQTEIDLFPAWQQSGRFFVYPYSNGAVTKKSVFPLQSCALTGQAIPAEPEKVLEQNYGAGWRDPDPLFKFPWRAAQDQFAPFLERLH
jgi:hypothetical protein